MKTRISLVIILSLALMLPVAMLMIAKQAGAGQNAAPPGPQGPGDIYTAAGYPCAAAHSTTRALFASYKGSLYQVRRQSDGKTMEIGVVQPSASDAGGYADAAAQDAFCADTLCWITAIYDQSGKGNHLYQAPPGTFKGPAKGGFNTLPIADMAPITIMGHKAYGVYIMPGMGLRNNNAAGLAVNDEPQGIYMVFDGTHYDSGCCFNYGNTSTNSRAVGTGTMDTVYFGTATAWGSGSGTGPWIMSDMEAGLFSGYNAKQNAANPTIDSWRFVTGTVNGGGGNQWEIRGGNAQNGGLTTFYKGPRPGSRENSSYFPMHRKGAVQMGNGGDNGNGSAGTFYEGIITSGYPSEDVTNEVHANIVAAGYHVPRVSMSRVTTFSPASTQDVTVTFTNTTGAPAVGVKLSILPPADWTFAVLGLPETSASATEAEKTFADPIAPGASVNAIFKVTSPKTMNAGYLTGKAEWKNPTTGIAQSETTTQRIRNAFPIKINEVRLTNQFIELYNANESEVDISNWTVINTRSEWAPVKLATIPSGTKIAAKGFYLLGQSSSGLAAPAQKGDTTINVSSIAGFAAGQEIKIEGETRKIENAGTAAAAMTTVFIPVSTGPWLTFPVGSTNLPVTSAAGFEVGQKIGIDIGGNYELTTVTSVGKAATLTTLSAEIAAGATSIRIASVANISVGDILTVGTGGRKELVTVKSVSTQAGGTDAGDAGRGGGFGGGRRGGMGGGTPGVVELAAPLKFDQISGVDVSAPGTGISFSPATRFQHMSGDAVQALGSGITLDSALSGSHEYGAAVVNTQVTNAGYQGTPAPNQWFGNPLSASAGSIALMDASGKVVVDAMVYGSQQSSSSANGTITSPEIAVLEGDQSQGGCIVVAPSAGRGGFGRRGGSTAGEANKSLGRFPDGKDTDSNCNDFLSQSNGTNLAVAAAAGANNIKVSSMEFSTGQTIIIDSGENRETAVIAAVGTAGGTAVDTAAEVGATVIIVAGTEGFSVGQTITIDSGENSETAVIASVSGGGARGGRFGMSGNRGGQGGAAAITVTKPLIFAHDMGVQVSGTGVTLTKALTRAHNSGAQVAGSGPTPGAPNQYFRRPQSE
ncbi:MAG: lamin tail domain-containing protein [Sedimentisphaerales bacterium]|nr:lamin tail domain-containing protein [Sedimentisphaerales bacterium]